MTLHHPSAEQIRLEDVLAAMGHPVRMQILRTLAQAGECTCNAVPLEISKSTATHHWRVLREAGVIHQRPAGRTMLTTLRRDELEARFPGLLDVVLGPCTPRSEPAVAAAGAAR
ncbi:ArsR/SmtB family transcription factor [Actinomadura scrupuli]|uniref:ArsR/SmtB family transcription factor n=1 Tax=Actinomadura scrupuli TaxID=559629 RepID=UPI003D9512A9